MLSQRARERYARQLVLPGFGEDAQKKLLASSVLIIGAGGLGSPSSLYLAAAGFGRIGIIDADAVDLSNLHRQILFTEDDLQRDKVEVAAERLGRLSPDARIEPLHMRLTSENALDIFSRYDMIIDGSDNFATRYLTNDAAVLTGKPLVAGTIFRFEGQLSVFNFKGGPCYRCLFPEPPAAGTVPDCAEGGVVGALPGTIGSMQAVEAIKIAAEIGEPLSGRMLIYDALTASTRSLRFSRDPDCPVCSENPEITELIDYEAFCGVPATDIETVTAAEVAAMLDNGNAPFLLDVRQPFEWEIASIGGTLIPLDTLEDNVDQIPRDRDIVAICRSGQRSAEATRILQRHGFDRVKNLEGGLKTWRREVDPSMRDY